MKRRPRGKHRGLPSRRCNTRIMSRGSRQHCKANLSTADQVLDRQLEGSPSLLKLPTIRKNHPPPGGCRRQILSRRLLLLDDCRADGRGNRTPESPVRTSRRLWLWWLPSTSFCIAIRADDIVIGTPISNRTTVETESMIGLFINTSRVAST